MKYWKLYLCRFYKIFLGYYRNKWVCAIKKVKRNKFCISGTVIQQVFIRCVAKDANREPDSQGSIFTRGSILQRKLLFVKTKYLWLKSRSTGPCRGKSLPLWTLRCVFSHKDRAAAPGEEVPAKSLASLLTSSTNQKVSSQLPGRSLLACS